MSYILAQDREGNTHNIKAEAGLSLMEILKEANLDIEAVCGGQCVFHLPYLCRKMVGTTDGYLRGRAGDGGGYRAL